jgi:hypothetical protein
MTLSAGSKGPLLASIVIKLPGGLTFTGSSKQLSRSIAVTDSHGHKVTFTSKVGHGALTIGLRHSESSVKIVISSSGLKESGSLAKQAKAKHPRSISSTVDAIDTAHLQTKLKLSVTP